MSDSHWRIRGYDSDILIFETKVKVTFFSHDQIRHLLKALVAKAGLTYPEIVGAYAKRKTNIANVHLLVHKASAPATYMCGSNPNFTAIIVDEKGKIVVYPRLE